MGRSSEKDIRHLIKECEDEGLTCVLTKGGHWKISGKGWVVTVSATPKNSVTCVKEAKRDLRRNGVTI